MSDTADKLRESGVKNQPGGNYTAIKMFKKKMVP